MCQDSEILTNEAHMAWVPASRFARMFTRVIRLDAGPEQWAHPAVAVRADHEVCVVGVDHGGRRLGE